MKLIEKISRSHIDWILLSAVIAISVLGLVTMHSFSGENYFFERQMIWIAISLMIFFTFSFIDFRFLRRTKVVMSIYITAFALLLFLLFAGSPVQGSQRWIELGFFSFQVSEFAKLALIIILAKYFTKRHIEIANFKHILISGAYAFIFFALIFFQPDFGSAIVIALIWLGMVIISGISKKHLGLVFLIALASFSGAWFFALEDYQKTRVVSFLQPYTDMEGSGYHKEQSRIAIGSGQLFGKGIGFGTQSELKFLPEHETDFIFSAYAEEWGFVGSFILLLLFGIIIWRILKVTMHGESNFEILFGIGVSIMLISHITIHIGTNMGLLPVTGITLPFMSFGGSHTIFSFAALGILMGMNKYSRVVHKEKIKNEVSGI